MIFSFLLWLFAKDSMGLSESWIRDVFIASLFFILATAAVTLLYFFEADKKILLATPFLYGLPFLIFFKGKSWVEVSIFLLAIIYASYGALKSLDQKNSLRLAFRKTVRPGLGYFITAMSLLLTLIFFWSPYAQSVGEEFTIPRPLFDATIDPIMKILTGGQGFSAMMPTSELPDDIKVNGIKISGDEMKRMLEQAKANGPMIDLNYNEKNSKSSLAASKVQADSQGMEQQYKDEIYNMINLQIKNASAPYKKFVPAAVAVSFFFSLKIIGMLLLWPIIFLAWVGYKLLLSLKLVKIGTIKAEKEVLEF